MNHPKNASHLKLLQAPQYFASEPAQLGLFSMQDPRIAIFASMSRVSGQVFLRTIESLQPRMLVDVRVLPRFDLIGLTRAVAFRTFEEHKVVYRDVAGLLNVVSRHDARMNAAVMAEELDRLLPRPLHGPILFLTESEDIALAYSSFITRKLEDRFPGWKTMLGWPSQESERP